MATQWHDVNAPKDVKGDMISLGTEAGIDVYLYWDGGSFKLYESDEVP